MKWSHVKAFLIAGLKSFWHDKANVFWVIVWPIILVLMSAYVFIPPSAGQPVTLNLGVINYDRSITPFNGSKLIEILNQTEFNNVKMFNVIEYGNESLILNDLGKGKLDIGIVIPNRFGENITIDTSNLKVYIGGKNLYSMQVNRGFIQGFLYELSKKISFKKISITLQYVSSYEKSIANQTISIPGYNMSYSEFLKKYLIGVAMPINVTMLEKPPKIFSERPLILGWYVLGAVGMSLLYTGFITGATAIVAEKERSRLDRILSTPTSETELLLGKLLLGLTILLITAVIVIFSGLVVGAKFIWNPLNPVYWLVILNFLLIGIMTISIGFLLSLVTKTSKSAENLGVMLGLLLAFTAGIWFPREWMPKAIRVLADIFPVTWSLDTIRSIMLYNISMEEAITSTIKVAASAMIIFALGIVAYRKTLRRYAEI